MSQAPQGCLQYYTDVSGIVQTFNYEDAAEIVVTRQPSYFVSIILKMYVFYKFKFYLVQSNLYSNLIKCTKGNHIINKHKSIGKSKI